MRWIDPSGEIRFLECNENRISPILWLAARGKSTMGRVPSAVGVDARRRDAGDAGVHRRGAPTQQMPPRRRNTQGSWGFRAISSLLVVNQDPSARPFVLSPRAASSSNNSEYFSSRLWTLFAHEVVRVLNTACSLISSLFWIGA
jgi:hypothetical protein